VERLLKVYGVNVNAARQQSGSTPLFFASQEGHAQVVNLLIQAKADVNISRTDGRIPSSSSFSFGFTSWIHDQVMLFLHLLIG
jgi:ankyrin repeat protein